MTSFIARTALNLANSGSLMNKVSTYPMTVELDSQNNWTNTQTNVFSHIRFKHILGVAKISLKINGVLEKLFYVTFNIIHQSRLIQYAPFNFDATFFKLRQVKNNTKMDLFSY